MICLNSFDGKVVAKLPFEPIALLRGVSHRNLMGSDYTDCSFIFLYILCTMSVREVSIHDNLYHNAISCHHRTLLNC